MPRIIRAEYLSYYNSARNSDKLFNIFLIQEDDGTFSCLTENGRRGINLVRRTLCSNTRRETAESHLIEKLNAKRFHQDTPYSDERFGANYSQIASQFKFSHPNDSVKTNELKATESKTNVIAFPIEKSQKHSPKQKPSGILNSDQFDSLEI